MKTKDKYSLQGIIALIVGIPLGLIGDFLTDTYELPTWASVIFAIVLIALFCIASFGLWRSAELDELQSLIRMRALAISAVILFAIFMVFWSLHVTNLFSGEFNVTAVWFIMAVSYGAGQVLANWKYRMVEEKNEIATDGN